MARNTITLSVCAALIGLWIISKSIQIAASQELDAPELEVRDDTESLFKDFEEKADPLWKCDGWYGGVKWRIPKFLDCAMPSMQEENKVVEVTLFLTDINQQTVQGYECYGTKTKGWVYRNFFDAKTTETKVSYLEMSRDECWSMINNNKAPDGRPLNNKGGVIGTFAKLNLESYWWYNASGEVVNYAIVPLKIAVLEFDKSIQTTSVLQRPCLYNESECPTEIGILVWHSNDVKTCRLKELETTSCIYAYGKDSKRLTCPDVELSLHDIQHIGLCHHTLGASSQGIFFAQKRPYEIDDVITTPDVIRSLIRKPKRVKRDLNLEEINAQEAFINAKLNYLYEVVTNHTAYAINKIHHDVCKANQMNLNIARFMAETGHPTIIPRYISGDSSYRAALSGDALSIYQCTAIRTYKFLPRKKCTREWPVEYIYDNKLLSGYVSPLSHTIIKTPTIMSKPCNEFFFDGEHNVYQLTNTGAVLARLPTVPNQGDNQVHFNFPELSFRSGTGFDISDITDVAHTYSIIREVQARSKRLDELAAEVKEITVELTPIRYFWKSTVTMFSYLPTFVKYSIGIVASVLTASLLCLACIKFSLLIGTVNIFITGTHYVASFFKRVCSKKPDQVKEKKKRRHREHVDLESFLGYGHVDKQSYTPSAPIMDGNYHNESVVNRNQKSLNRH